MKHASIAATLFMMIVALPLVAPSASGVEAQQTPRMVQQGEVSNSAFHLRRAIQDFEPHPATQDPSRLVTAQDLSEWVSTLSNWGRWGAAWDVDIHPAREQPVEDERGTLNLITSDKQIEAANLVTEGIVVTLAAFLGINDFEDAVDTWNQTPAEWWPISNGGPGDVSANDAIKFGVHDGIVSHMTALCYSFGLRSDPSVRLDDYGPYVGVEAPNYAHQNSVHYNGYAYLIGDGDSQGCARLGINRMGVSYTSRAVLYDIAHLRGVEWLDPTTPIFVEDLEEWEEYAGVKAGPGDVMIVRTGRWAQREAEGPWYSQTGGAGLHASVLPWLKERDIAVLVGDAWNDVQPSGVTGVERPIHQMALVMMGLPLVNNAYPEDAARVARELRRWEFMVTWKNLDIPGGSGSPWNAVGIF